MSRSFYFQQQGHGGVRLYRLGDWVEASWEGERFQFKLQSVVFAGQQRLLLRFRDSTCCQQSLLRIEAERILFKSAYTVAAQRYEPRRTAVTSLGVREGDLLLGSDVWSVDLLLSELFSRPASLILRAGPAGLVAIPFRDSRLAVLGEAGGETVLPSGGPLKVLAPEQLRAKEGVSATFFGDEILYEVTNLGLGDDRAHFRLAAIGYVLPTPLRRITLGSGDECLVRLYSAARRRGDEELSWNIWFEALHCQTSPGTVLSAVGRGPGEASDSEEFDQLLNGFLPGWAPQAPSLPEPVASLPAALQTQEPALPSAPVVQSAPLVQSAPVVQSGPFVQTAPAQPVAEAPEAPELPVAPVAPQALADKSFVLNKCEEVLALVGDRPELASEVRRLRGLLAQEDYHQASILAEQLRPRPADPVPQGTALDHGRRFRVDGQEMLWLDRRRLPRQSVPEVHEFPGMLLYSEPQELCRIRVRGGLQVQRPGRSDWENVPELRFGRDDGTTGPEFVGLPAENLMVSSRAARLFLENGEALVGPWRESLFEGDAVLKNFQLLLEHPEDRSRIGAGDFLVLGNLVLDLAEVAIHEPTLACRLRGAILDRSELTALSPDARLRFRAGVQVLEGAPREDDAFRAGPYRLECKPNSHGATLTFSSGAGPLIRFGKGAGDGLCYSQRKRLTRVRRAPLYPVTDELLVGYGWQQEGGGTGVEMQFEGKPACYFRIAVRSGQEGKREVVCKPVGGQGIGPFSKKNGAAHWRGGSASPDDRLRAGDELVCGPVTLRVQDVSDAEGLDLELHIVEVDLPAGQSGWIAGLDAEVPEGEPWVLRLPAPFPQTARLRWTGDGHYQLEGEADVLDREIPGFAIVPEPAFQVHELAPDNGRLRVGGPGSDAEILHAELPSGLLVATLERTAETINLRPVAQDRSLWRARPGREPEPVPAEGFPLSEGDRFGVGSAELHYRLQEVS